MTASGLEDGEWHRRLDAEERKWLKDRHKEMLDLSRKKGPGSQSPCHILRGGVRSKYTFHNQQGQFISEGPPRLTPQWIAFTMRNKRFPKFGYWSLKRAHNKGEDDDIEDEEDDICSLSHLCGEEDCIVPDHVIHELTEDNNDRIKCHAIIRKYARRNWQSGRVDVKNLWSIDDIMKDRHYMQRYEVEQCPHKTHCFVNFGEDATVTERKNRKTMTKSKNRKRTLRCSNVNSKEPPPKRVKRRRC